MTEPVNAVTPITTYPLATIPPVDPEPPAPMPDPLPPGPSPDPVPPAPQPTPLPGTPDPLPPGPTPDAFTGLPNLERNPYITASAATTFVNPAPHLTEDLVEYYESLEISSERTAPVAGTDVLA